MISDSGFEIGQERVFDYALVPHLGDWREAGIHREGLEFNHPLLVSAAESHRGELPSRWSFLQVWGPHVVMSALKPGEEGGAVLRIHEATGLPAHGVEVKLSVPMASAKEANLMEDPLLELPVRDDAIRLDLRPFEIKTICLQLQRLNETGVACR